MNSKSEVHFLWEYELGEDIYMLQERVLVKKFPLRIFRLTTLSLMLLRLLESGMTISGEFLPKVVHFAEYLAGLNILVRKIPASPPSFTPYISVIIPVKDRPQEIDSCLNSIFSCNYPAEKMEVIVVDDGSADRETAKAAAKYPVKLIEMSVNQGQSTCRNIGIRHARGDIIAFTDSDCVVSPNWLIILSRCFIDPQVALVGGGVYTNRFETLLDYYEEYRSPLFKGNKILPMEKNGEVPFVPTCNLLVRKKVFEKIGGFNEVLHVGEDVDLIWRILNEGYKGWYVPEGCIWHHHRNKFLPFLKRRAQYAASESILSKRHNSLNKALHFPFWHIPLLAGLLFAFWFKIFYIVFAVTFSMVFLELFVKHLKLKRKNIPVQGIELFVFIMHSYYTTFRFSTALLTRYYFWLLLLITAILPAGSWFILLVPLISSLLEYKITYRLSFPQFLACYFLEMLAYSLGFLYGCLKHRQYNLLILSIKFR
jgi:mycofactocin system glycosyltransferase